MELWDAYDEALIKSDCKPLIRGKGIPNGVFHLICKVSVRHTDGSYLIMRRDLNKHLGPLWQNWWFNESAKLMLVKKIVEKEVEGALNA